MSQPWLGAAAFNSSSLSSSSLSSPAPYHTNPADNLTVMLTERLAFESQLILITLYTLTTVTSVVGNAFVIIVFTIGKRSRSDLRPFLINLACADLIMAIFCMPFTFTMTMLSNWIFSAPMCPIVLFMQTVSVTVSVCTNMAIGLDRFWVVMYPLKSRITKSRSKMIVAAIWFVSVLLSSVQLVVGRSRAIVMEAGVVMVRDCAEQWPEPTETWRTSYTFFILIITYLLPLSILSCSYGFVGLRLWQRTAPGNADERRDMKQMRSKIKIIKMLAIVVLLFGICWLPLHVFILVMDFHPQLLEYDTAEQKKFFTATYYSVHWLAMSNSFVNPIIYGFLNDSFRTDLKRLLALCFPCCRCLRVSAPGSYSITYRDEHMPDRKQSTNTERFSDSKKLSLRANGFTRGATPETNVLITGSRKSVNV